MTPSLERAQTVPQTRRAHGGLGDRGAGRQVRLRRRGARSRRRQLRSGEGGDPGFPRPQRRRQVDHHQDAHRPAPAPGRDHHRAGHADAGAGNRDPGPDRGVFRGEEPLLEHDRAGEPDLLRPALRPQAVRRHSPATPGGPRRPHGGAGGQLLQGSAAAPHDRPGTGQRS